MEFCYAFLLRKFEALKYLIILLFVIFVGNIKKLIWSYLCDHLFFGIVLIITHFLKLTVNET